MGLPIVLGVVGILLFMCFIVAFVKSNSLTVTLVLFASSLTVLACFLSSLTAANVDETIKRCSGFVYANGYYVDTATGLCFHGNYPIDCNNIVRILPEDIRACIIKNRIK